MPGLEELLNNEDFVRWVLNADEEGDRTWNAWLRQNPGQEEVFAAAQHLIRQIYASGREDARALETDKVAARLWDRLNEEIRAEDKGARIVSMPAHALAPPASRAVDPATVIPKDEEVRKAAGGRRWLLYASAACLCFVVAGGFYLWRRTTISSGEMPKNGAVAAIHPSIGSQVELVNQGETSQLVHLVDGTRIRLEAHSRLRYDKFLHGDKREVTLEGEAFFDVAKDAHRPFYVHTRGVLTHVLGTSFLIIARQNEMVTIAVKTGKVAVSAEDAGPVSPDSDARQYILQANQEIIFNKRFLASGKLVVTDSSLTASRSIPLEEFTYTDAPVSTVLQHLSDAYSVDIGYDKAAFAKCRITVSLDGLSFEEKLGLLCKVLDAHYKIEENKVFVEGKGCQ